MTLREMPILWRVAAVGALMTLVLVGGVLSRAATIAASSEIVMRAEGFDPRSPLVGHYVAFRLVPSEVRAAEAFVRDEEVWAQLARAPAPERWRLVALSRTRPSPAPDTIALRAEIDWASDGLARVRYGPDRIYLPQRDALRAEKALRPRFAEEPGGEVAIILAVPGDGRAIVKGVVIEGERILTSTL